MSLLDTLFTSKAVKAWVGAVTAAGSALGTALADGSIDGTEVGVIVGAFLVGLGLVYRVPNRKDVTPLTYPLTYDEGYD